MRCGQCTCERRPRRSLDGSRLPHARARDGKDARRKCPGMVDGKLVTAGALACGSDDGLGLVFREAPTCFCAMSVVTLATAPRTGNNQWIVHAMNGENALYRKVVDSVPKDGDCPAGTTEQGGVCVPLPLELKNYNNDCSCKFGFAGATCETPRMMCLFDGEETGTSCVCTDQNGKPNEKVSSKGCCTKGRIGTRSLPCFLCSWISWCSRTTPCTRLPSSRCALRGGRHSRGGGSVPPAQLHRDTDEYILEETACNTTHVSSRRCHTETRGASQRRIHPNSSVPDADPVQWCMQHCDVGFVREQRMFLLEPRLCGRRLDGVL